MKPKENYYDIIENHSRDGWRLVQILDCSFQQRDIEGQYGIMDQRWL